MKYENVHKKVNNSLKFVGKNFNHKYVKEFLGKDEYI